MLPSLLQKPSVKTMTDVVFSQRFARESPPHQKTWPNGELYWVTDAKLALKLLEDADEQHSLRRDRSGAGITRAYGSLRRSLLNGLRRNFGFDPSEIFDSCSHSMMDDVTQSTCSLGPVHELFGALGIPATDVNSIK